MNKISSTIKDRSIDAAYRVASKNLIRSIKSAIIKSLSKNDNTKVEMISAFLETEYGDGLILALIGFGLPLAMDKDYDFKGQTIFYTNVNKISHTI